MHRINWLPLPFIILFGVCFGLVIAIPIDMARATWDSGAFSDSGFLDTDTDTDSDTDSDTDTDTDTDTDSDTDSDTDTDTGDTDTGIYETGDTGDTDSDTDTETDTETDEDTGVDLGPSAAERAGEYGGFHCSNIGSTTALGVWLFPGLLICIRRFFR